MHYSILKKNKQNNNICGLFFTKEMKMGKKLVKGRIQYLIQFLLFKKNDKDFKNILII